jgi:hypothetical protein
MNAEKNDELNLSTLRVEDLQLLHSISQENRKEFIRFIDSLKIPKLSAVDWWITAPVSRNPYASDLYLHLCLILLVKKRLSSGAHFQTIVAPSKAMAKALRNIPELKKVKIRYAIKVRRSLPFRWIRETVNNVRFVFRTFFALRNAGTHPLGPIFLVGTYIYPASFKNGIFHDRHFPQIFETLLKQNNSSLWFFPTFYDIIDYHKIVDEMQKSGLHFLIREKYLKINDYLFALMHPLRVLLKRKKISLFKGLDISSLVLSDLYRNLCYGFSINGLLNYRFAFRLAQAGVQLQGILDWYENQSHSRGWILGSHRFYPNVKITGYLGFPLMPGYLCIYPTPREVQERVIPDEIGVIGSGYIEMLKEFINQEIVFSAPALRFRNLWDTWSDRACKERLIVGIALPVVENTAEEMLQMVYESLKLCDDGLKVTFLVKGHPAVRTERLKEISNRYLNGYSYSISESTFTEFAHTIDLMIGTASSTCFESIIMGISTIILANRHGFSIYPVLPDVPQELAMVCFSVEELKNALIEIIDRGTNRKSWEQKGQVLRDKYCHPVSTETIDSFLKRIGIL